MFKVYVGGILNLSFISIVLFGLNRNGSNYDLTIAVLAFPEMIWRTTCFISEYKNTILFNLYKKKIKELESKMDETKRELKNDTKKKTSSINLMFFYNLATSYSSTQSPEQYHRRCEA